MFVRETRRRNRDGSVVTYLQLAHSVRDRPGRAPRTEVLHGLGRADAVDRDAVTRLVAALGGHRDAGQAAAQDAVAVDRTRELGAVWVLDRLWRKLGLDRVLTADPRLERVAFALVARQVIDPGSKVSAARWATEHVVVPGCAPFGTAAAYAAMDLLGTRAADLSQAVVDFAGGFGRHIGARFDLVLVELDAGDATGDPTNTVLPRSIVAVAATAAGLPLRCRVHPPGTPDQAMIDQAHHDVVGWRARRVIRLTHDGVHTACEWASVPGTDGHTITLRRITAADRGAGRHLRFYDAGEPGPHDGWYAVAPSGPVPRGVLADQCADVLAKVQTWRRVMHVFRFGPVLHYRADRVDAHVQLVWLAVLLARTVEIATNDRWHLLMRILEPLRLSTLRTAHGEIDLRGALSPDQEVLFAVLGIDAPPWVFDVAVRSG